MKCCAPAGRKVEPPSGKIQLTLMDAVRGASSGSDFPVAELLMILAAVERMNPSWSRFRSKREQKVRCWPPDRGSLSTGPLWSRSEDPPTGIGDEVGSRSEEKAYLVLRSYPNCSGNGIGACGVCGGACGAACDGRKRRERMSPHCSTHHSDPAESRWHWRTLIRSLHCSPSGLSPAEPERT